MKKGVGVGERDREKTDRDKERRKKEKKLRKDINKQNISGTMSSEELLRLDEVCVRCFAILYAFFVGYGGFLVVWSTILCWAGSP